MRLKCIEDIWIDSDDGESSNFLEVSLLVSEETCKKKSLPLLHLKEIVAREWLFSATASPTLWYIHTLRHYFLEAYFGDCIPE